MKKIIKPFALILALVLVSTLFSGGVWKLLSGGGSAKLRGEKISFSKETKKLGGYLSYSLPEGLDWESDGYGNLHMLKLEDEDGEVIYCVRLERHSVLVGFGDMEEDASRVENNDENEILSTDSAKYNGTKWAVVSYKTYDDDLEKDIENHVYYGVYDRLGIREWFKITFFNAEGETAFEKAFMKKVKIG